MGQSPQPTLEQQQRIAMNVAENVCSIFAMPVEMILRPFYGTRYFPAVISFLALVWMLFVTAILSTVSGVEHMIPFAHVAPPQGLFGIGDLAELFFLLFAAHSVRLWWLMIHPEREDISDFEGPPLPFFRLLPKSRSFWFTRIVLEPAFVFVTASVLKAFLIVQPNLAGYLHFIALAMAMKQFLGWYRCWEELRKMLDARNAAPLMARVMENTASEQELSRLHLASFPMRAPSGPPPEPAQEVNRDSVPMTAQPETAQGGSHESY
jgi:hypothetical protein